MKIEKISEMQLKVILEEDDLIEHGIKPSELVYGTDKIYSLFQELMEQALEEYGFEVRNTPLLVEAMQSGGSSIVIIITKIKNPERMGEGFSLAPNARLAGRFKAKGILEVEAPGEKDEADGCKVMMYAFDNLDGVISASERILKIFEGESAVYKQRNRYFMLLEGSAVQNFTCGDIEAAISEYGQKYAAGNLSEAYLQEHGEVIIKENAISKLALTNN